MDKLNQTRKEAVIYGGAFNPPTLAHIAITRACVEYARERGAEVWLLPSGSRSDKTIAVPREQRLRYIDAMIADVDEPDVNIVVRTDELDRTIATETYDTVMDIGDHYPDVAQTWVFGADSLATMESWKEGEWLKRNLSMLVFKRIGADDADLDALENVTTVSVATPPVSSTQVRAALQSGDDFSELVGSHVGELLKSSLT